MNATSDESQLVRQQTPPPPPELHNHSRLALFLDFDGTLVDIAPHPDAIAVADGLPALLDKLNDRLDGRLAIVSGRQLADLDRHMGRPNIAMAGSHGGEFREAGAATPHALANPFPSAALDILHNLSREHGGLLVEPKPFSAAIHYREHPQAAPDIVNKVSELAETYGLQIKHGKMVVELVMPGSDKGSAVARFMEMPEFTGALPVFLGDDVTDEDAFEKVLDFDGGGVLVGQQRDTAAKWRLPGVTAVHDWLRMVAA